MLASVATFAIEGIDSKEVCVEVDVRRGLPAVTLVGLPDTAIREARERVRAATRNSGLEFPMQRITANLAPAHIRKTGASFDLALAVAMLCASGQIPRDWFGSAAVWGELSLGGTLRPMRGAMAVAAGAKRAGYERLLVPAENASEAALVDGVEILGVPSLRVLVDLVHDRWRPDPPAPRPTWRPLDDGTRLADGPGQAEPRRT